MVYYRIFKVPGCTQIRKSDFYLPRKADGQRYAGETDRSSGLQLHHGRKRHLKYNAIAEVRAFAIFMGQTSGMIENSCFEEQKQLQFLVAVLLHSSFRQRRSLNRKGRKPLVPGHPAESNATSVSSRLWTSYFH